MQFLLTLRTTWKKKELVKLFDFFLGKLSERDRDIFIRRYWYMDPIKKIADRHACGEARSSQFWLAVGKNFMVC